MKKTITTLLFSIFCNSFLNAQSITGNLTQLVHQTIKLEGFNGLKTYPISSSTTDNNGNFKLTFSAADYGVGYLISNENKPFFVILSKDNIELIGETLSIVESINVNKSKENQWFEQYAKEHPKWEQALIAWEYLEKIYTHDALFSLQKAPIKAIQQETKRIKNEDATFLNSLPKESYCSWYLPMRRLVSSVSNIAQYQPQEIPTTIQSFRKVDYTDQRFYKSGLYKDAIESHFWLLENSGKNLDSIYVEMQLSIDTMITNLVKDDSKLNEVTHFLFDLLEKHSLFKASEYLALKVLNLTNCSLESDLAKQLESYRAMKKGTIATDIAFQGQSYVNGIKQIQLNSLSQIQTPYTLVIFGASWCPKCNEELPITIQNYSKWKNQGVEVVFISLDTDSAAFEKAVKSYPFIAYSDYKKWESTPAKDYYIFATPTYYLLNQQREIILRPTTMAQMDAWVDWYLIQNNK
jgi:thiol-disulfide isomerase/thioredoxin